ncbi:MAG: RDD family protein [Flavobacteriaceae bacterium]|nr:MAG: RDD family protein [Flavobacteriaceae bacterium]
MTEQTTTLLKSSRKRRFAAFIIDHFVLSFLIVSICFLAFGPDFIDKASTGKIISLPWIMSLGFLLYLLKDSIKGISIGKWAMGIMVRDENNPNQIPSMGRLFLRNLPFIIWPVEFIVLAISDQKKRLGDKIAKTIVVKNPDKPGQLPRILMLIGVGIVFFIFFIVFIGSMMKNSDAYKTAITEIEKSEEIRIQTGGIKGYGIMPTGNISVSNNEGQAQLEIKVLGNTNDMHVNVYLEKENGQWKVIEMQ